MIEVNKKDITESVVTISINKFLIGVELILYLLRKNYILGLNT